MNQITESDIQKAILDYLDIRDICWFRINTKGEVIRKGKELVLLKNKNKGFSDIFILIDGKAIFLETKSKKGVLSPAQKLFADKVINKGKAKYFVVRSIKDTSDILDSIYRG